MPKTVARVHVELVADFVDRNKLLARRCRLPLALTLNLPNVNIGTVAPVGNSLAPIGFRWTIDAQDMKMVLRLLAYPILTAYTFAKPSLGESKSRNKSGLK